MKSAQILRIAIGACQDRKAEDILTYDVQLQSVLTDYYLICSAGSVTQIRAIMNCLEKSFKAVGMLPRSVEGNPESGWIIMDYNAVLIHIFQREIRNYYNLEELLENRGSMDSTFSQNLPERFPYESTFQQVGGT